MAVWQAFPKPEVEAVVLTLGSGDDVGSVPGKWATASSCFVLGLNSRCHVTSHILQNKIHSAVSVSPLFTVLEFHYVYSSVILPIQFNFLSFSSGQLD